MAKRRTVVIQDYVRQGRTWKMTLQSASSEFHDGLVGAIRQLIKNHSLVLVNSIDPFPEPRPERKKRGPKVVIDLRQGAPDIMGKALAE